MRQVTNEKRRDTTFVLATAFEGRFVVDGAIRDVVRTGRNCTKEHTHIELLLQ